MGNSGAAVAFALFTLGGCPITKPAIVRRCPPWRVHPAAGRGGDGRCRPIHLLNLRSWIGVQPLGQYQPRSACFPSARKSKGNEQTFETRKLLEKAPIHFIGNVEGVDIMRGSADVIVCDGFVGNVILKFGEGLVEMFSRALKMETDHVLGADFDSAHRIHFFRETMKRVDYIAYGGALLLGVNGHC